MHRNTKLFIGFLAVITIVLALVRSRGSDAGTEARQLPLPTMPAPTVTPAPRVYANAACGVTLTIPGNFTVAEPSTRSALFTETQTSAGAIAFGCAEQIPRPPLPTDSMEKITIGSVSAVLYHDSSAKDGTPVDVLIFRHPRTKLDVLISGIGTAFDRIIRSVTIR
jgi:hypothetical protein